MKNKRIPREELEQELDQLNLQIRRLNASINQAGPEEQAFLSERLRTLQTKQRNIRMTLERFGEPEVPDNEPITDIRENLANAWEDVKSAVGNVAERLG